MKLGNGDVLEVYEESEEEIHESEGSDDDEQPHGRKFKTELVNTVTLHSEPTEKAKKRKLIKKKKKLTKSQLSEKRKLTQERKLLGLVKPDVTTNREKERLLKRIATKGVVQLFNAVAERQRVLAEEMSKKMTAKERRETMKRLQGDTFHVYPEKSHDDVMKMENKEEEEDDDLVKRENESE
nr:unnamed protein product [Haemonchus contortus]